MRHSASKSSLKTEISSASLHASSSASSTLSVDTTAAPPVPPPKATAKGDEDGLGAMPMIQAVNAALMTRTAFTIDDAKDDGDDYEDEDEAGEHDDEVMDEVCVSVPLPLSNPLLGFKF